MAEILGKIPAGKLKLLEKALGNLAVVAKNSGPLNEVFQSMKEGAMITAPWNTFLTLLKAEATRASIDSIKSLLGILTDPGTSGTIDVLAAAVGGWMASIDNIITSLSNLIGPLGETEIGLNAIKAAFELLLTPFPLHLLDIENLTAGLKAITIACDEVAYSLGITEGVLSGLKDAWRDFVNFLRSLIGLPPWTDPAMTAAFQPLRDYPGGGR